VAESAEKKKKEVHTMKLLAYRDVTIHRLLGEETPGEAPAVETEILSEGEYVDETDVPSYLLKAVKDGEVSGIVRVTEAEAVKAAEQAAEKASQGEVIQANQR
jgi:hypothetical protein